MLLHNVSTARPRSLLAGFVAAVLIAATVGVGEARAQDDRVGIDALTAVGAFRIDGGEYGASQANYSAGPIGYKAESDSLFITGLAPENAIAEFEVPSALGDLGTPVVDLPVAANPRQSFVTLFDRTPTGNPDGIDRINGLFVDADGRLLVNAEQWYDADGGALDTTLVVEDADAIAGSIQGFFQMEGGAHAGGYMSAIPEEWQERLGGQVLTGWASNTSIISRHSVGPSLFAIDPSNIPGDAQVDPDISTTTHMDFPFSDSRFLAPNALQESEGGASDLWNFLAKARYGFIVPGTSTFMVLGSIGGVDSGIGYKITQDDGNLCGGHCAYAADDYDNAYWLFDLDDILAADEPHLPRPYAHGTFDIPYDEGGANALIGASFDPGSGQLFVSLDSAGRVGDYDRPPLIVVYDVATGAATNPQPTVDPGSTPDPDPAPDPDLMPDPDPAPDPDPTPDVPPLGVVERVAGASRIATAAELSRVAYPDGADVVVLARADQYPDALAGGSLATRLDGPMLLTDSAQLSPATAAEIERLGATDVVVLGGTAAVSPAIVEQFETVEISVRRIAGATRFDTAAMIAAEFGGTTTAYLALGADRVDGTGALLGDGWPDAVAAAALAAQQGSPILLTTPGEVPEEVMAALEALDVQEVVVVGGPSAILPEVEAALAADGLATDRIAGDSRFQTAGAVVDRAVQAGADPLTVWIATGRAFPDALTAGPVVAATGGVMFLAESGDLTVNAEIAQHLAQYGADIQSLTLIGGPGAISETFADDVAAVLTR